MSDVSKSHKNNSEDSGAKELASNEEHDTFHNELSSVREEAHALGLCQDYFAEDIFSASFLRSTVLHDASGLFDISDVSSLESNGEHGDYSDYFSEEKWDIDKVTAARLVNIMTVDKDCTTLQKFHDCTPNSADLRMEDVILSTDPLWELDQIQRRHRVVMSTRGMQPFDRQEDINEELRQLQSCCEELRDNEIEDSKLQIDIATMQYLNSVLNSKEDQETIVSSLIGGDNLNVFSSHMSLPLLPTSSPHTVVNLSPPTQEIEFTSSPEDLIAMDAAALEHENAGDHETIALSIDQRSSGTKKQTNSSCYLDIAANDVSSSPSGFKRPRNFKTEPPLTPNDSDELPLKKGKLSHIFEGIHSVIPPMDDEPSKGDDEFADKGVEELMEEIMAPHADSIQKQFGEEQLSALDTLFKVPIPAIETHPLVPSWEEYTSHDGSTSEADAQRILLHRVKRELFSCEKPWSGISKLEEKLPWKVIPLHLATLPPEETFTDQDAANFYFNFETEAAMEELSGHVEPFRAFQICTSDEEELEYFSLLSSSHSPQVHPPETVLISQNYTVLPHNHVPETVNQPERLNMQELLKKRMAELNKSNNALVQKQKQINNNVLQEAGSTIHAGNLANGGGLAGYMHLQAGIKSNSLSNHDPVDVDPNLAPSMMAQSAQPVRRPTTDEVVVRQFDLPHISSSADVMHVVIASRVLNNRLLIRHLHRMMPNLEFTERHQVNSGDQSQEAMGADMTLSPATGLVLTTLQKLKQRPLPGQTGFLGIRDQINAAALLHERVLVLISEGRQDVAGQQVDVQSLDERDCESLADLNGYTLQLPVECEIRYVPGGEESLAHWVAASLYKYALQSSNSVLIQDETLWERFLRSAGMNTYAAQVVLKTLQSSSPPKKNVGTCTSAPALSAFVRMSREQRIELFGQLFGGERVLNRVGDAIDNGWLSAIAMRH